MRPMRQSCHPASRAEFAGEGGGAGWHADVAAICIRVQWRIIATQHVTYVRAPPEMREAYVRAIITAADERRRSAKSAPTVGPQP
jgi:hypothetical protein